MKNRATAYLWLYLVTSQTFAQVFQRAAYFDMLRRDARMDVDVTCHDDVVSSKMACASSCLHDDQCRVFSSCEIAPGKTAVSAYGIDDEHTSRRVMTRFSL